jgi:hypothetical protein
MEGKAIHISTILVLGSTRCLRFNHIFSTQLSVFAFYLLLCATCPHLPSSLHWTSP